MTLLVIFWHFGFSPIFVSGLFKMIAISCRSSRKPLMAAKLIKQLLFQKFYCETFYCFGLSTKERERRMGVLASARMDATFFGNAEAVMK